MVSNLAAYLSLGDELITPKGVVVTLRKGYGKFGAYFFSHHLEDGLDVVYGAVHFDTKEDVAAHSQILLGRQVIVGQNYEISYIDRNGSACLSSHSGNLESLGRLVVFLERSTEILAKNIVVDFSAQK